MNPQFKTQPLTGEELAVGVPLPSLEFVGVEIENWLVRKLWIYREEG